MKKSFPFFLSLTILFWGIAAFADGVLPKIHVLATGGTIAATGESASGSAYTVAQIGVADLIKSVPGVNDIAEISGEQFVNIGSQDMELDILLRLADRVNELMKDDQVDGIVITHGTDTMEETAYFLNLTVNVAKPVVLTGAMRASTALSADGPANLLATVATAASRESIGKGVLVVMNDQIFSANAVTKINTLQLEALQAPDGGMLGYVFNKLVYYNFAPIKKHTMSPAFDTSGLKTLPKVGIIYCYAGMDADMMLPILTGNYQGVVLAGVGNGNFHKNIFPALLQARQQGVIVVRASRVPNGAVTLDAEVDDAKYQFVASGHLNPAKARILLMLALTQTNDWQQIQAFFDQY